MVALQKYRILTNFPPALIDENLITLIFCPGLKIAYIVDVVTFTALAKNFSANFFRNIMKVAGLEEIFIQRKFSRIRYAV